jgi:hypothetical protein
MQMLRLRQKPKRGKRPGEERHFAVPIPQRDNHFSKYIEIRDTT